MFECPRLVVFLGLVVGVFCPVVVFENFLFVVSVLCVLLPVHRCPVVGNVFSIGCLYHLQLFGLCSYPICLLTG